MINDNINEIKRKWDQVCKHDEFEDLMEDDGSMKGGTETPQVGVRDAIEKAAKQVELLEMLYQENKGRQSEIRALRDGVCSFPSDVLPLC